MRYKKSCTIPEKRPSNFHPRVYITGGVGKKNGQRAIQRQRPPSALDVSARAKTFVAHERENAIYVYVCAGCLCWTILVFFRLNQDEAFLRFIYFSSRLQCQTSRLYRRKGEKKIFAKKVLSSSTMTQSLSRYTKKYSTMERKSRHFAGETSGASQVYLARAEAQNERKRWVREKKNERKGKPNEYAFSRMVKLS